MKRKKEKKQKQNIFNLIMKPKNPRERSMCWVSPDHAEHAEPVTFQLVLLHFSQIYW